MRENTRMFRSFDDDPDHPALIVHRECQEGTAGLFAGDHLDNLFASPGVIGELKP